MDVVITKAALQGHSVNKYKFKVLSMGAASTPETAQNDAPPMPMPKEERAQEHAISSSSRDALVESLLKKTDEMSSNFIKLQMKLEDQEEAFKGTLEAAKKEAFEQGMQEAMARAKQEGEASASAHLEQFAKSVQTLERSASEFHAALGRIEHELVHAAIDIAKEVVAMEVSERSEQIATKLASKLIKDLQGSTQVTLKVNPKDHGAVSEKVGSLAHVSVLSDSAIAPGGVVALSDSGNIDSEIMKRYERVKKAALGE
jgi:flagellar assembly protein FliH